MMLFKTLALVLVLSTASAMFGEGSCSESWTHAAEEDGCNNKNPGGKALRLPLIQPDLPPFYVCGGGDPCVYTKYGDGDVHITGTLQHITHTQYKVDVSFMVTGYMGNTVPMGSPFLGTGSCNNDGAGWHYWEGMHGNITGRDAYDGGFATINTMDLPAFQAGPGASNKNSNFGGAVWFRWAIVTPPDAHPSHWKNFNEDKHVPADMNIDITPCEECWCDSVFDNSEHVRPCNRKGGYAFRLPAVSPAGYGPLFFCADPSDCQYSRHGDDTIKFHGILHHGHFPNLQIEVHFVFTSDGYEGFTPWDPRNPYFGAGRCYDGRGWEYWNKLQGTITGVGNYAGGFATVNMEGYPAAQMGIGGNNKDHNYGLSAWFDVWIQSRPDNNAYAGNWRGSPKVRQGDMNVRVHPCDCSPCVRMWHNAEKTNCNPNANYAIRMPALTPAGTRPYFLCNVDDVEPMCTYKLHDDMSLEFQGRLKLPADENDTDYDPANDYLVDVHFTFPASGFSTTPPTADNPYFGISSCGDASDWYYYAEMQGTIIGRGAYSGGLAHVDITPYPAAQVGTTGSNKNTNYGISGWFDVVIDNLPDADAQKVNWRDTDERRPSDLNADMDPCSAFYTYAP